MLKESKAFAGFSVNDLKAAKSFYGETLGVDVKDGSEGLELQVAGGTPIFIYPKSNHEPATYTVLNFPVDDIEKTVDELVKRGVTIERYDDMKADEKGIARGHGMAIAWFKDPAGNILSVIESNK
ncbi:MAG: VOC family protein [Pyrinomonadaceae bacterium]